MDANKILYDCIVKQYGDVAAFSDKSGIPHIDLNAVLLKDNVSEDICIGLNLCSILNIDAEEFIFNSKIKEAADKKNLYDSGKDSKYDIEAGNEIYSKCMRLSENEKKKVLDYINGLTSDIEFALDEADKYAEQSDIRLTHEDVFKKIRKN